TDKQLFAGAIYGDHYYISGPGVSYDKIFKININDKNVTDLNLSEPISLLDFAFTPEGAYLHGIVDGGRLVKIDTATGAVTFIGDPHIGYQFDSTFSDNLGRFFANDSKGNGFFEFDLKKGEKLFLSDSQPADYNDGTNCLEANLTFMDYGDAPASYGSARHNIANGVYLGYKVDHDIGDYDTLYADGDDKNGVDDEDGITMMDGSDINGSTFVPGETHQIKVTISKEAYLKIWINLDESNNHFSDAADLVYKSETPLSAGTNIVDITLPSNIDEGRITYLRARVSSNKNLNPVGLITDGEVEDYVVRVGYQRIQGRFNIQRTNTLKDSKDFALYTQIVGRDFNYHVVFYDEYLTAEEELEKVPLKIELMDEDNPTTPLYTTYLYYYSLEYPTSRILVMNNSDLDNLPAIKKAIFNITYAVDSNGNIIREQCDGDIKTCFDTLMASGWIDRVDPARDKFAIRPESFYMSIGDGTEEIKNSIDPNNNITLASGYDEYNLTFIATQHNTRLPSNGYHKNFKTDFDFNSSGTSSCANTSPIEEDINFTDGSYNNPNFSHDDVGRYTLTIADDSNWTAVDQNSGDCEDNQSFTSPKIEGTEDENLKDYNIPSGCNIKLQLNPLNLTFQPDHFDVNLTLNNLPNSSHPDFLYMSELNTTYNRVAIQFLGDIIAQTEDNKTTKNFTAGCMATNLLLDLNATTLSVNEIDKSINIDGIITTINGTDVDFTRLIRFNPNSTSSSFDLNRTLDRVDSEGSIIQIGADKFLDENNGTLHLDMRYNLNKHLTQLINPVEVSFHGIEVNSTEANSISHNVDSHIPKGNRAFTDNRKNFYFARVVPDMPSYPIINTTVSRVQRHPLNVDIFCDTNLTNYCRDREVLNNTNLTSTTREAEGGYVSINHNEEMDGNVTNLVDTPDIMTPRENLIDATDRNITFSNGENNLIDARINDCNVSQSTTVTITTTPELRFEPSEYIVNCTDNNASQWTGVGQTGNILNVKPKINSSHKIDW
ncbi:hypothetical protein GSY74_02270, partial [Sulfurovum sp. bin170]|uniref:GEVED domain-containing protein n=1 Tax=Sulfurovum sp. bin170 TaxID=2695268 RepID=UPI0013DF5660